MKTNFGILKGFFTSDSNDPDKNKKKQNYLIGGVAATIAGAGILMILADGGDTKKVNLPKHSEAKIIDDTVAAKTNWIGAVAPKVDESIQRNEKTEKAITETNLKIEDLANQLKRLSEGSQTEQNATKAAEIGKALNYKPGVPPELPAMQPPTIPPKPPIIQQKELSGTLGFEETEAKKAPEKESSRPYIPTGAFTRAVILQGINAPTMSKAKTNPLPIMLRLTDLSVIPNRKKLDIKECFVLGEGFGELASERVHIRTITLSCVTKKNQFIDMPIKGYITDDRDGVMGVAGKVVSKQGALLARTIVSGFFQGVGQAFGNTGQTLLQSPLGTTTSQPTDPAVVARAGAYQGASKAAEKLADFYMKMADSLEPVIEIPGGLGVTVVVSLGSAIDIVTQKKQVEPTNEGKKDKEGDK